MGVAAFFWALGISWCVSSLLVGAACLRYPGRVIAFQQRFYLRINWRMEPVSMAKEVRNTRFMGAVLVLLGLAALGVLAG